MECLLLLAADIDRGGGKTPLLRVLEVSRLTSGTRFTVERAAALCDDCRFCLGSLITMPDSAYRAGCAPEESVFVGLASALPVAVLSSFMVSSTLGSGAPLVVWFCPAELIAQFVA
jgi:hypothetical protein